MDYIAYAQDIKPGGWRYNPGEPGDTTVTGWMLMALKSGQMAKLNVQSPAIFAAQQFLDSVQNKDGSQYGYRTRQTAAGHHGRGTFVPHVYRLAAGQSGPGPGRRPTGPGDRRKTNLLRLLCHAGALPLRRAGVGRWNRKMREHC